MTAVSDAGGEEHIKPKRKMKTPFQLETLENTFAADAYPSEAIREELSIKLSLTDRQLQMWFCHRRLKGKKEAAANEHQISKGIDDPPREKIMRIDKRYSVHGSGFRSGFKSQSCSGSESNPISYREHGEVRMKTVVFDDDDDMLPMLVYRAVSLVEAQLGEPLREDGPILAVDFDHLPPGAFGASIEIREHRNGDPYTIQNNERHNAPQFQDLSSAGNYHCLPQKSGFDGLKMDSACAENLSVSSLSGSTSQCKINGLKMGRKAYAHEKFLKNDVEKQEILRRMKEEPARKETKKSDCERKKEEERLMREKRREKQREEVKLEREQRREIAQRERFLLKESLKAEKIRQRKALQKERELAKQRAANERATARRIAKESMGLIDDEQLELMELSSLRKELHSEHNTSQNLPPSSDFSSPFPPNSVKLKRPFPLQPWINSDENIGNLLMVWRFLISFADVLELWPFTLDEFVQSFHDSDSRLLCEVHMALLKLVIKDINVGCAPSTLGGVSQNSTTKHEGLHQSIIEGARAWGFDISSWRHHLNALTWPEILRQHALSAGFGPQLKKTNTDVTHLVDNCEISGSQDIISTLRNGSAAESAAARMKEKGFPYVRKSKHLLTPGTVKFAAFHVLSLEGSQGITISELADKIQNSGLRDLRTSKAPEASIAAALSRDSKLFERKAPSTYCVRSPFRKDPCDAELVLSSAREKLNNTLGSDLVAGEENDGFEKDECSEYDGPKGSEIVDPANFLKENRALSSCPKLKVPSDVSVGLKNSSHNIYPNCLEIDNSKFYEPWVQGLARGEYSVLSVEERLDALVSLVGVANGGQTIHTVLENRVEAANTLKKQMWAEALLDKKYINEESRSKLPPLVPVIGNNISEAKLSNYAQKSCESLSVDRNCNEASLFSAVKQEHVICSHVHTDLNSSRTEKYVTERSRAQLKSFIALRAEEMYVHRCLPLGLDRRHNRYWQFAISSSSSDPGSGRIFIETWDGHWQLIDSEESFNALVAALDSRGVREYHLLLMLLKIEESFKEKARKNSQIVDHCEILNENKVTANLSSNKLRTASFKIESRRNETENEGVLRRYEDFEKWISEHCFHSLSLCAKRYGEKRCKQLSIPDPCINSFDPDTLNLSKQAINCEDIREPDTCDLHVSSFPPQTRFLKALLALIEMSIPSGYFYPFWKDYREIWCLKLHTASLIGDLLQVLTLLESAIQRNYVSSNFHTTMELLGFRNLSKGVAFDFICPVLPWIPVTTAALILRLLELDASISYKHVDKEEEQVLEFSPVGSSSSEECEEEEDVVTTEEHSRNSECEVGEEEDEDSESEKGTSGSEREDEEIYNWGRQMIGKKKRGESSSVIEEDDDRKRMKFISPKEEWCLGEVAMDIDDAQWDDDLEDSGSSG